MHTSSKISATELFTCLKLFIFSYEVHSQQLIARQTLFRIFIQDATDKLLKFWWNFPSLWKTNLLCQLHINKKVQFCTNPAASLCQRGNTQITTHMLGSRWPINLLSHHICSLSKFTVKDREGYHKMCSSAPISLLYWRPIQNRTSLRFPALINTYHDQNNILWLDISVEDFVFMHAVNGFKKIFCDERSRLLCEVFVLRNETVELTITA